MKEVVVDGEEVVFEGAMPEDPSQVYELLMNALSEQGKVVVGFSVDGKGFLPPITNSRIITIGSKPPA